MAFDDATRRRLLKTVNACRKLLTEDFDEQLRSRFGIYADEGRVREIEKLTSLDDTERETARLLRERITHIAAGKGLWAQSLGHLEVAMSMETPSLSLTMKVHPWKRG